MDAKIILAIFKSDLRTKCITIVIGRQEIAFLVHCARIAGISVSVKFVTTILTTRRQCVQISCQRNTGYGGD